MDGFTSFVFCNLIQPTQSDQCDLRSSVSGCHLKTRFHNEHTFESYYNFSIFIHIHTPFMPRTPPQILRQKTKTTIFCTWFFWVVTRTQNGFWGRECFSRKNWLRNAFALHWQCDDFAFIMSRSFSSSSQFLSGRVECEGREKKEKKTAVNWIFNWKRGCVSGERGWHWWNEQNQIA